MLEVTPNWPVSREHEEPCKWRQKGVSQHEECMLGLNPPLGREHEKNMQMEACRHTRAWVFHSFFP